MDINKLNNISEEDLSKIPGIGEDNAKNIIEYRDKIGGFKDWSDLEKVPGLGKEVIDMLKNAGSNIGI